MPGYESIKNTLVARGKNFLQYTKPTHQFYMGSTLRNHPGGDACALVKNTVFVEGHVMVDFRDAFRENVRWVGGLHVPEGTGGSGLETTEDYPMFVWKDRTRKTLEASFGEKIYEDNDVDSLAMDDYMAKDQFLSSFKHKSGGEDIE